MKVLRVLCGLRTCMVSLTTGVSYRWCWTRTQWSRSWWVKDAGRTPRWAASVSVSAPTRISRDYGPRVSSVGLSKPRAGEPEVGHQQSQHTENWIWFFFNFFSELIVDSLWSAPVPSCADIRGTFPSAWTPTQFSRMSEEDLDQCVEVLGQDSSLNSQQRRSLWVKLRQVSFGSSFPRSSLVVRPEQNTRTVPGTNVTEIVF